MKYTAEPQNNAHPPISLSVDPPWIGFPSQNWGASLGPTFSVYLDPQIDVRQDLKGTAKPGPRPGPSIGELADEFADWNDELLRELAR